MVFPRLFGSGSSSSNANAGGSAAVGAGNGNAPTVSTPVLELPTIRLAPSAPVLRPPQPRMHELPRLQVPSLALMPPTAPNQPQLHWKTQAMAPTTTTPPPMSRMRMVANFFSSSETRQHQQQPSPMPATTPTPPSGGMLPSFHEILARTKQLYINQSAPAATPVPTPVQDPVTVAAPPPVLPVTVNTMPAPPPAQMEQAQQPLPAALRTSMSLQPVVYAPARYSLEAPTPIDIPAMTHDEHHPNMTMASPCDSMTDSQSGKLTSKRRERWTEDEHARFMEGLNRYGRKWKKIQAFVKTKTAVQVRTHAYGYFAKLLRNMPEDEAAWELAEEMSSLPGAVLKGPSSGKRRSEPKTDEAGMEVLRRFVFSKKKSEALTKMEAGASLSSAATTPMSIGEPMTPAGAEYLRPSWGAVPQENWNALESQASSVMLDLKRQRIN